MSIKYKEVLNTGYGFYSITIEKSGFIYLGSTRNISNRISHHIGKLRRNMHYNKKLQDAYNLNKKIIIDCRFTETREEAYDIEQEEVNKLWGSNLLCNVSKDVRSVVETMHTEKANNKRLITTNKEDFIKSQSERTIEQWKNPEFRNSAISLRKTKIYIDKLKATLHSEEIKNKAKAATQTTEYKENASKNTKKLWEDPIYREKTLSNRDPEKIKLKNMLRRKPLLINGNNYNSAKEASLELNYTSASISRLARDPSNLNFKYIERNNHDKLD